MNKDFDSALTSFMELYSARMWQEWESIQPDKRLSFDIQQGWDAAWEHADAGFKAFLTEWRRSPNRDI